MTFASLSSHPAARPLVPCSYAPEDVTLLVEPLALAMTSVAEKERAIQQGRRHYSEMLSFEAPPTADYIALYERALADGGTRMAQEAAALARRLDRDIAGPITLVGLLRAGLPLGVLLVRALRALGRDAVHYGLSIIRDRGIDRAALDFVLAERPAAGVVFVDGWTGKGAIAGELSRALADYPHLPQRLVVLADPGGFAWAAASAEDWLIPSGILGGTVSGLVSRSVLPAEGRPPGAFHGAMPLPHLAEYDVTRSFVDALDAPMRAALAEIAPAAWDEAQRAAAHAASSAAVSAIAARYAIANLNRLKPGLAEATRAVLRRLPERVLVRDPADPALQPLLHLAEAAGATVEAAGALLGPYRAVTLIAQADR